MSPFSSCLLLCMPKSIKKFVVFLLLVFDGISYTITMWWFQLHICADCDRARYWRLSIVRLLMAAVVVNGILVTSITFERNFLASNISQPRHVWCRTHLLVCFCSVYRSFSSSSFLLTCNCLVHARLFCRCCCPSTRWNGSSVKR